MGVGGPARVSSRGSLTTDYDRDQEFRAFFDSKAGVKGVVDSGVENIPRIFVHSFDKLEDKPCRGNPELSVPVIDIGGISQDTAKHSEIVDQIRDACETWGFFKVVNHGVPVIVTDKMVDAVRVFHKQDAEMKRPFCTSDPTVKLRYNNGAFDRSQRKRAVTWSDSVSCLIDHLPADLQEVPAEFRSPMVEYINYISALGMNLPGMLSEALGLQTNHLEDVGFAEGLCLLRTIIHLVLNQN